MLCYKNALLQNSRVAESFEVMPSVNHEPATVHVGGASRRIDNMKRTIVVLATSLIFTAGQAMAQELTLPQHINGLSLNHRPVGCICTCLDKPCDECTKCFDYGPSADNRPTQVGTALTYRLRELSRISPNIARAKQSTPYISSERSCSAALCVGSRGAM